ncbi:hypothetical protein VIC_002599 [Vibrio coralliilyticus ATCC BAA-450]|nr:hypothetical protein VIC_002599 [Vibrio coralliilyticus ATCC BAA-450]
MMLVFCIKQIAKTHPTKSKVILAITADFKRLIINSVKPED